MSELLAVIERDTTEPINTEVKKPVPAPAENKVGTAVLLAYLNYMETAFGLPQDYAARLAEEHAKANAKK